MIVGVLVEVLVGLGVLVKLGGGVTDGVLVRVGVGVIVDVRVGVRLWVEVGLVEAEAVMVKVEVSVGVGVWVGVVVTEGLDVTVLSTGWKGVLVAGRGRVVAVAVNVAGTEVELGTNGRYGESADGRMHPIGNRHNSKKGKTTFFFMIIPSQS